MKRVLITGSKGFIGKNLFIYLKYTDGLEIVQFDIEHDKEYLKAALKNVDFVFHLAGVNRSETEEEFIEGNVNLTKFIIDCLIENHNLVPVVLTSSTQVELDNAYGKSKFNAEQIIRGYIQKGGVGYIFRLTNVFGKWCRPDYNSVVATFCYNIATEKEIKVSDREKIVELVYVDDIIIYFKNILMGNNQETGNNVISVKPTYKVTLGKLADLVSSFKQLDHSCLIPDFSDDFVSKLHSTYLSYVPLSQAQYSLEKKTDDRGYIFEFLKSDLAGQIFVSRTKPGITRGNHFHHSKSEKFCVIQGEAVIKLRHLITNETYSYKVNGQNPTVVNILPGYTHSISNTGKEELITIFWANEPFDPDNSDTYFEKI
jgi:UDP-2-acetamido-2,6-beta-L-arabino-hexul-4-ose reductase